MKSLWGNCELKVSLHCSFLISTADPDQENIVRGVNWESRSLYGTREWGNYTEGNGGCLTSYITSFGCNLEVQIPPISVNLRNPNMVEAEKDLKHTWCSVSMESFGFCQLKSVQETMRRRRKGALSSRHSSSQRNDALLFVAKSSLYQDFLVLDTNVVS